MTFWIFDGSTSLTTGFRFWIQTQQNKPMNLFPSKFLADNRKPVLSFVEGSAIQNLY
jgi:hypothetical protein